MIDVVNLTKKFGKKSNSFTALDNVSFSIESGSTLAIVGKSGSGKSTLMHVMSGLDHPTSGSVTIDDVSLFAMKQRRMDNFRAESMSFIFQSFFVEANQTCMQNVLLPLEIAKSPITIRKKMALEALEAVDLSDKANVNAANLSGGQKQRLAIARAIVNKPSILFADEPTGNLDSATGEKVEDLLFSLNESLGCTLVVVTHDDELAAKCTSQLNMKDGKVASFKTAKAKKEKR